MFSDACRCRCGGRLAVTALAFVAPALLVRDASLRASIGALVVTSLLYHGLGHTTAAKTADVIVVRAVVLHALSFQFRTPSPTALALLLAVVAIHVAPGTHVAHGSTLRVGWHATMHACGAMGLLAA